MARAPDLPPRRRHSPWWGVVAGVVLVILAILTYSLVLSRTSEPSTGGTGVTAVPRADEPRVDVPAPARPGEDEPPAAPPGQRQGRRPAGP